ncbi:MAG: RHS repeat-associated core domain-containing protein, partial [Ruminococcus sp.]|nr:RHS repeat-associated core domain-containing protein [Ruminococcus sp.]
MEAGTLSPVLSIWDRTGNYVIAETNQAGYTVNYTYDVNGNITSSTDAKGYVTNYTYDVAGNISTVSSGNTENQYFYNASGLLSSISHNSFTYQFNYDVYHNLVSTQIGDVALATNTYNSNDGTLKKTVYANGDYLEYEYDSYDNIVKISGENGVVSTFVYNKKGLVSKVIDVQNDRTIYYYYDLNGNVEKKYCQAETGELAYYVTTNSDGEIIEKTQINGQTKTIVRGTFNGESYVENDGVEVTKKQDEFERVTQVKTSKGTNSFYTDYEYKAGSEANSTTNLVSKITQKYKDSELVIYKYAYDKNGNITQVTENDTAIVRYRYDELNQLISVGDRKAEVYTCFTYDDAGNITNVKEYKLTTGWTSSTLMSETTYSYEDSVWKDKLTSYNGSAIEYDELGNPLSYRDLRLEWENGRQLKSITTSDKTVSMKYDFDGLRIEKDSDDRTIYYHYDGENNLIALNFGGSVVYFYYDCDGELTSMAFNGTMYYYIKNLQGDIVEIVNQNGTSVVTYTYDSYGKIIAQTDTTIYDIANLNPFRYRGYVYDDETGLYYLNSRYYDPETGRFINADIYCDTMSNILGTNMFTY